MQDTLHRATTPASQLADTAIPRFDIYNLIHKGLRLLYGDTLARIGSVDADDAGSLGSVLAQTVSLLDLLQAHYGHEDRFVHPALEAARAGSSARIAGEHDHHGEAIADLRDLAGLVRDSRGNARAAASARLYRALALFVADNFQHMHVEETAYNAVLWAHYSDDELMAIEHAIVASIPPAAMSRHCTGSCRRSIARARSDAGRHAAGHAARAVRRGLRHRAAHALGRRARRADAGACAGAQRSRRCSTASQRQRSRPPAIGSGRGRSSRYAGGLRSTSRRCQQHQPRLEVVAEVRQAGLRAQAATRDW